MFQCLLMFSAFDNSYVESFNLAHHDTLVCLPMTFFIEVTYHDAHVHLIQLTPHTFVVQISMPQIPSSVSYVQQLL